MNIPSDRLIERFADATWEQVTFCLGNETNTPIRRVLIFHFREFGLAVLREHAEGQSRTRDYVKLRRGK